MRRSPLGDRGLSVGHPLTVKEIPRNAQLRLPCHRAQSA